MIVVREIARLRGELAPHRRAARAIGLVPTMGALHEGHLSLVRRARELDDVVVVSLFVNPTQFDDPDDLRAYPRNERRDRELLERLGVEYLFAPDAREMYPGGFSTTIHVSGVSEPLEGAVRGVGHFDAVATVVAKLLNIVAPHRAYFGAKDAQQVAVIKRLVRDLDMPVGIEVCPTVREDDGLALSSRNQLLADADRARAPALSRALVAVAAAAGQGRAREQALAAGLAQLESAGIQPDYLEIVDPSTMKPAPPDGGERLAVVAARLGGVRLIDNLALDERGQSHGPASARSTRNAMATPAGAPTDR